MQRRAETGNSCEKPDLLGMFGENDFTGFAVEI